MIQVNTRLKVSDNSGAKEVLVIGIPGDTGKRYAYIGDLVTVSVKKTTTTSLIKKGSISKALILRTKYGFKSKNGSYIKFDDNAVVMVKDDMTPRGTRIFGPAIRNQNFQKNNFSKFISLAEEVLVI
ncbi:MULTISPECIES: 50S ribosomal protein L14 [16SrII (Peanut WB group)]|uniref:Large ribosomal subunit protein uL14 n=2 Tax=16SrII (Peanut WB group) TaxID=85621 RepID=A0A1S9M3E5_9MOLU|nr:MULTISPECIES: 50S ribosomal protein L14 [Phytoplasma]MDO8053933.1 50S ribosomal protein L14 ['Opuntia sp.' phytoplasma]MDO8057688.1 50S ribosomal protein L14 ['Opuntia sp.' phytoplasma]MDO8060013.1 50S ribosomal protein L14 [Candidatus Phytoplasma aurantifolia]MDO8078821.1 50S ribosomal protein L14 [Candidatus Phytoplasma aurantifolia]OOP59764.1 50S ribosomal protein L14 [Candidatus Phytoplasma aurantifolia]